MRLLILIALLFAGCSTGQQKKVTNNHPDQMNRPYVLLISIDGYRWDYTKKHKPKFLTKFKNASARLKSLRPSFPTKTFPNHLTLVTGRYPSKHGIVANHFYDPELKRSYSLRDKSAVRDGDFYQAMPIWSLAESQGMRAATYFWPGSEAKISGHRPSYYLPYEHGTPHQERLDHVVDWFKLPKEVRPHFVTLYFHDVDSAGHKYGPFSKETKDAVHKVDKAIEQLISRLDKLNLPLNIIITSDHGMMDLKDKNFENIIKDNEDKKYLSKFKAIGHGPLVHFYKESEVNINEAIKSFNHGAKNYKCYGKDSTPRKLNFRGNPRIGDLVCIAGYKWSIGTKKKGIPLGNHGWSQYKSNDMHAIFYAKGPNFKKNLEIETQNNINIYPLMAKILGLKIDHEIDGKLRPMKRLLK